MKDLNLIITDILKESKIDFFDYPDVKDEISSLLVDNHWFHTSPKKVDGKILISPDDQSVLRREILHFISRSYLSEEEQYKWMIEKIMARWPTTAAQIQDFLKEIDMPTSVHITIFDFLLYNIQKDIFLMNDSEIQTLVGVAIRELNKAAGDVFVFFLSWLKLHVKTRYHGEYTMTQRVKYTNNNAAYRMDEYLNLMYYLFNEDYLIENDMYIKAAQSKNFADTWLYLALHYMCALRGTDIVRICHPQLTSDPSTILKQVSGGTFPAMDAKRILSSITWRFDSLMLSPHKTKEYSNIPAIKFHVPTSCETLIGTLFAVCEAHYQIVGLPPTGPLIRQIKTYEQISRYMGEEIGDVFLESNFLSRAANKSYLQSLNYLSDKVFDSDGSNGKGYILAATARSHKGSYGEYITITAKYLQDMRFTGYTPEFIAMELFERGVLSFIPGMLLKMVINENYNLLTTHEQTELIKYLDLTPYEVEQTVKIHQKTVQVSQKVMQEIMSQNFTKEQIMEALQRIAAGTAFSKTSECGCVLTAFRKSCCDPEKNCAVCPYEISTKTTIYLFISEYNRMFNLYLKAESKIVKDKYKKLIQQELLPKLYEVLLCYKEMYGEQCYNDLEKMIKENTL